MIEDQIYHLNYALNQSINYPILIIISFKYLNERIFDHHNTPRFTLSDLNE